MVANSEVEVQKSARLNIVDADDINIAKEFMERRMKSAKTVTISVTTVG
jgi:hypothetical protein